MITNPQLATGCAEERSASFELPKRDGVANPARLQLGKENYMSNIADKIYEIIRDLPEAKAAEILDFAEFVKSRDIEEQDDFFALAGLWEDREIGQESLRKQAWPQR